MFSNNRLAPSQRDGLVTSTRRAATGLNKYALRPVLVIILLAAAIYLSLHFFYFNLHTIVPGQAYRSSQPSKSELEKIVNQDHIRSILKFNRASESSWSQDEFATAKNLGIKMFYIPIGVSELPSRPDMIQIIQALDHAPRPLLVHCKTGADRTGFASVLLAMQAGESFQQAKNDQLRLAYGHVGHIGEDVADVLTQYDQDRAAEGKPARNYADFCRYVLDEYYPGFHHAGIELIPQTISGHAGQTVHLKVKITNLTRRPWAASWLFPFRLDMGIPGPVQTAYPDLLTHKRIGNYLGPGQSLLVDLPVKIPNVSPGLHRYTLDISEVWGVPFAHFGSSPANVYLDVKK